MIFQDAIPQRSSDFFLPEAASWKIFSATSKYLRLVCRPCTDWSVTFSLIGTGGTAGLFIVYEKEEVSRASRKKVVGSRRRLTQEEVSRARTLSRRRHRWDSLV